MKTDIKKIEDIYKRIERANKTGDFDSESKAVAELDALRLKCTHPRQTSYQSHAPSVVTICLVCDAIIDERLGY